jgi:outer membrane receptor protein involved in Fe transport
VGGKGRLFDGKLDYQLDGYLIQWHDIQVGETTADGSFNFIGNAGDAIVKGTELEFTVRPVPFFSAGFAGSYQSAYLSHGATPDQFALNPTLGLTGESIPEVPRLQFSADFKGTRRFADNVLGVLAADVNYRGKTNAYYISNPLNVPLRAYTLLSVRAGLEIGPWTANVFARNLTNNRAEISALTSFGNPLALITVRPRTVGVNLTRTF